MAKWFSFKLASVLIVFFFCIIIGRVHADTVICTIGGVCSASPETVSVSAIVGTLPSIDEGTGGGVYQSGVKFSGFAYPGATVTVQKRNGSATTVLSGKDGSFSIVVPETDWQLFTLFATDVFGRKSTLLNFPTVLYSGYLTDISGIRFAPTITTDKISVKKGDFLTIEGSSLPNTKVRVAFDGIENKTFLLESDTSGSYNATVPIDLVEGDYTLRSNYPLDTRTSKALRISVGTASILRVEATSNIPGDCNVDQKITLVDFSVLAYWYGKPNPPKCVDPNTDNTVNLVDFSIVAFYWNG